MKRSPRSSHKQTYQVKRMKKIIDSQLDILKNLMRLAYEKGQISSNEVVYLDHIYDIRFSVREDDQGVLSPCGKGLITCVGQDDVDFMKFMFDEHSLLTSHFNFQWGRSKGEAHFIDGYLAGSARIIEAIDTRFVSRSHLFSSKSMMALLVFATCAGLCADNSNPLSPVTLHSQTGLSHVHTHNR